MSKNKLERYAALPHMENVYFHGDVLPGDWSEKVFNNPAPVTLELACGDGGYSLALAGKFPHRNFLGVDIKGERIYKGARRALERKLTNVAFLRAYIQFLDRCIKREIDLVETIWIPFPDPYPRTSKKRKRLTSPFFLDVYRRIIRPGGSIHLKTDSDLLYGFTLETLRDEGCTVLRKTADLYESPLLDEVLGIKTMYEKRHLAEGRTIKYIEFRMG